jgi:competence protein ComEC
MAISGFHITMVAALFGGLMGFLWRRSGRAALWIPAQKMAVWAGWLASLGYCLIAGMGVPAQRTLIMLTIAAFAMGSNRATSPSRVLCIALVAVLLVSPLAVISAGFWLSFGAVALLLFAGCGRLRSPSTLFAAIRGQWAVTIGLAPILLALFGQFSLVSPIANALAIPVVSFLVTPLALAGAFLPIDFLLQAAHQLLLGLMWPIEWLADWPYAVWVSHAPPGWTVPLAMLGAAVLMLPRGLPRFFPGLFLMLPLFMIAPERPPENEARVTVLDVGQGLSIHVQTHRHDLIFDTGPQFSQEANSGNRIIVPYLRAAGVKHLDALVISHEDRDHSGGVHALAEALMIKNVMDSLPEHSSWRPTSQTRQPCFAGQNWVWDGVQFEMIHPDPGAQGKNKNDGSCVLRVSVGGKSLLISADIEAYAERSLIDKAFPLLRADYLVAPHHGSRTSSTPGFIEAVGAEVVIFPVGYRNRYRHPHPSVLERYQATGALLLRTDRDGALRFDLASEAPVKRTRLLDRRYWHDIWVPASRLLHSSQAD